MARKLLIKLIASVCIAKGLWSLCSLFSPLSLAIKAFSLIGCVLVICAGIGLFNLSETGRKLLLVLSSIAVVVNAIVVIWTIFFWKGGYASAPYFLDDLVFKSENRFISAGGNLVFLAIPLLLMLFLSQDKTKELFVHKVMSNVDSKTFIESA